MNPLSPYAKNYGVSKYQSVKSTAKSNGVLTDAENDKLNSYLFDKCFSEEYKGNYDFNTFNKTPKINYAAYEKMRIKEVTGSCYIGGKYYPSRVISYHDSMPDMPLSAVMHPKSLMSYEMKKTIR